MKNLKEINEDLLAHGKKPFKEKMFKKKARMTMMIAYHQVGIIERCIQNFLEEKLILIVVHLTVFGLYRKMRIC